MRFIFLLMLYYPIWAIPVGLGSLQVGWHLKRRKSPQQYFFWIFGLLMVGSAALWVAKRGDLHGDIWLRESFGIEPVQWH